ncbi:glycosyl hydrolase 115 family protein [Paenibacillus hexagrammi]|uniref:Glycosyl hydrolase 115 family protein n=1 Tax=Paenibacillus hexagrammi TaxID=2908839 RepID=A0ABY3SLU5_9BACL|nr:glycosyl hydrolase 115 family protein [Paenibacillus sp. YPD9-1]UJF34848.1 glycosyl hydrolase 115 family protein [Paenibacillus sp. YPD9-1]
MMEANTSKMMQLDGSVYVHISESPTSPVRHAVRMLTRDLQAVLGHESQVCEEAANADIIIRYALAEDSCAEQEESFVIRFDKENGRDRLIVAARDELGLVYGILYVSETYLGIQPFWFWADQAIGQKEIIAIPCENYDSPARKVRFRGWFVNDEVCLIGWKQPYPPSREVWLPVFEALLRCGGNMVIPGTDLPKNGIHFELASEMGLWITHHHAEPLGAEMFLRAYTGRAASYKDEPELFERLWEKAIEKQKHQRVLWVLSFRGQGDKPFWENDPTFDTPEKRGAMISKVIRRQYDMIAEKVENPVYCAALYGEISELYKGGYIDLPDDVIKVWADNGYGKMVSRRHGNLNLRMPALPGADDQGKHGVYYHVTFHDLQASNHLTMFQGSAAFICDELGQAFESGATEYLLVNSGNIRPHVYQLDLVRELWNQGWINPELHLQQFVSSYYGSGQEEIAELYRTYAEASISYGSHSDDLAGEEFYHHPARRIIGHWLQGKCGEPDTGLIWAAGDVPFAEQIRWFGQRCGQGQEAWSSWLERCEDVMNQAAAEYQQRIVDQLKFHGVLHQSGAEGFMWLCRSYEAYSSGQYPQAFVYASQSMWCYQRGLEAMRDSEHGKWERFYSADWLTNIASTVNNVDTLRRFLRMHGDSPDFFLWYKEYLMPETEKYIYLENTHRNPLSDDELAWRLRDYFRTMEQ